MPFLKKKLDYWQNKTSIALEYLSPDPLLYLKESTDIVSVSIVRPVITVLLSVLIALSASMGWLHTCHVQIVYSAELGGDTSVSCGAASHCHLDEAYVNLQDDGCSSQCPSTPSSPEHHCPDCFTADYDFELTGFSASTTTSISNYLGRSTLTIETFIPRTTKRITHFERSFMEGSPPSRIEYCSFLI